jgi:hypothetical protein
LPARSLTERKRHVLRLLVDGKLTGTEVMTRGLVGLPDTVKPQSVLATAMQLADEGYVKTWLGTPVKADGKLTRHFMLSESGAQAIRDGRA